MTPTIPVMITNTAASPAMPPNIVAVSIAKGVVMDLVSIVICQLYSAPSTYNTLYEDSGARIPPRRIGINTLNPNCLSTAS